MQREELYDSFLKYPKSDLSKLCPFFVYGLSRFGNQRSKEATARIAMFNDLKIPAIYTMESSFCGND